MSLARASFLAPGALLLLGVLSACGDTPEGTGGASTTSETTTSTSTTSTTSSTATGGGGTGGAPPVCTPGATQACYSGPSGTMGKGICKAGTETCMADGSGFGPCEGEVVPKAEDCTTAEDDDCDGTPNPASAGCVCLPGTTAPCYDGPAGTEGKGLCVAGTKTCAADGKSYDACVGQVLPAPAEDCNTPGDDDCNGMANEVCSCTPGAMQPCYSGPPSTQNVGPCKGGTQTCNAQGTGFGACVGEVVPVPETCNTPEDDNCNGMANEAGVGCVCPPNQMVACYTGPAGTLGVGLCKAGMALCNDQGTATGACTGDVTPAPETCNTPGDDDCNGQTNEGGAGCVCLPGSVAACYTGPAGTQGVGLCKAGTQVCNAMGTAYGACMGEVLPVPEICTNTADDDCNGTANNGCPTVTYAGDVQPIYQAKCPSCHTTLNFGGVNFAASYADTQKASNVCAGKKVGECTIVRIQNGSMPQGAGCTGNPSLDAGKPQCLTAAQQATIQAWIAGGMLP
jgi:hypothetical protein